MTVSTEPAPEEDEERRGLWREGLKGKRIPLLCVGELVVRMPEEMQTPAPAMGGPAVAMAAMGTERGDGEAWLHAGSSSFSQFLYLSLPFIF